MNTPLIYLMFLSLLLTKAAFICLKIQENINIVKYYYNSE